MKRVINALIFLMLLMSFHEVRAQRQPYVDPWWVDTIKIDYDFEQDGIYYKFAPAPRCNYVQFLYGDIIYTGLENEESDILWVTGSKICETIDLREGNWGSLERHSIDYYNCSYSGDVYIPDYVQYEGKIYPVKGLCRDAFKYSLTSEDWIWDGVFLQKKITSVRLPETLEYIDSEAFWCCQYGFPLKKFPDSLKYIGFYGLTFLMPIPELPDNVLFMEFQFIGGYDIERFKYPKNAIYAGQVQMRANEIIYPERMQHLICGKTQNLEDEETVSGKSEIVIPDNGEFYVHKYGLPKNVSTIYSYAPIMINSWSGYGFAFDERMWRVGDNMMYEPQINEKTLYVLPGLKEAYAKEWPELLAGMPYTVFISSNERYTHYYEEDHIIEVSREEMDAMVEAAGLIVPTAVSEVEVIPSRKVEEAIYTLDGRRWTTLQKGMNIVRQSDGTTKKVYVR